MKRAAAKRAEKRFQRITRDARGESPEGKSDCSHDFSDDSDDIFDLSKEIGAKRMFKTYRSRLGER